MLLEPQLTSTFCAQANVSVWSGQPAQAVLYVKAPPIRVSTEGIGNCIRTLDYISPASLWVIDGINRGGTQHTFDAMPPVILPSLARQSDFEQQPPDL